ncbi:MAG: low molecular weight phosphotyrosine protein phosphatase [Clostridia bacterium]|nr:low molecular weight phosphotyrosine protein phosphatase [Clostridia bacterium]
MIRILFVCHGNICRSPMAEFILRDMAEKRGIAHRVAVASCATSTEEIWNGVGNPVYPPAREELKRHGLTCEGKRAVQLKPSDYDDYDYLVGMDGRNLTNMRRMMGGDPEEKISLLMDYTSRPGDVADPWYSDRFDIAYRDIYEGCEGLMKVVLARLKEEA